MSPESHPTERFNRNEKELFVPSLNIKAHHAVREDTQQALLSIETPEYLASKLFLYQVRNKENFDKDYFEDVLGKHTDERIIEKNYKQYITTLTKYFEGLRIIPDASFIQLDLKIDGICKATIGRLHCEALNYGPPAQNENTVTDMEAINIVLGALDDQGFQENIDYKRQPTSHTFFDYQGAPLSTLAGGIPCKIAFTSLIVQAKALRAISRKSLQNTKKT